MLKPMTIEKAKNVSLVVLFLSTVLLLYFFWGNISFEGLKDPSTTTPEDTIKTVSLIKPEHLIVGFGSENYTVIPPGELWYDSLDDPDINSFVEELERFGPAESVLVEEITYENYQKVMGIRSIWAEFNYNIPMSDFCENFGMSKTQSYDTIEAVTVIGYSTADAGMSLFIHDGKNQKYYRLVAEDLKDNSNPAGGTEFPALIDSIEAAGYNIYYPISTYSGVDNNTLVPLSIKSNLHNFSFRQDSYSYQTEKIGAIAKPFFGGNFDFVRTIKEENGTIIYMYGYGQIVLIVNPDGSIEFKEELSTEKGGQSFTDALESAVAFIVDHGSWQSQEGAQLTPYLKKVIPDPDKKEGYRFVFGMEVNGNRLYYEEGEPLVIDVISGQVTYYKRNIIDFDQEEIETIETLNPEEAYSAVNLIAQNDQYIYDILLKSGKVKEAADQADQADQDSVFDDIAYLVNEMQIGYVKLADTEITEIQPAWIVTVKDTEFYFDLFSADPLGYTKE